MNQISFRPSKTRVELEPAEKLACMRMGMHLKAAEAGVSMAELAGMLGFSKEAQAGKGAAGMAAGAGGYAVGKGILGDVLEGGKRVGTGVALTSVMLGIPIGVVSHIADRALQKRRAKEQKLLAEADYYDDATRSLTSNLALSGN